MARKLPPKADNIEDRVGRIRARFALENDAAVASGKAESLQIDDETRDSRPPGTLEFGRWGNAPPWGNWANFANSPN